jgi:NADPH-dependent 2,4-dienoyl-CoA reductase/sulfur reductase-like enzyme
MCADEYIEGGLTLEDSREIARMLEAAGVAALDITSGIYESPPAWHSWIYPIYDMPPGCRIYLAEEIKKAVSIPVIASGRLGDPVLAEEAIGDGKADVVALGRPLLADPELPRKAYEGRLDDIRPCLYCNDGCVGGLSRLWHIGCQVNPALGRERTYRITPAERVGRVLVVGGGPGGMEAARIAALRGHSVTLFEKEGRLGGQLRPASAPKFKRPIGDFLEYLMRQVEKVGVEVRLGTEATPALIEEVGPDVLILATGATHVVPDIHGARGRDVATASEVLMGERDIGKRVVIVGGGQVGSELAWFLAEQGRKVTIVEMLEAVATDVNLFSRFYLLNRLAELGVEMAVGHTVEEAADGGVVVADGNGDRRVIEADTVVIAAGFEPNNELQGKLGAGVPAMFSIGDCVKPDKITGAIHGAWRVACQV